MINGKSLADYIQEAMDKMKIEEDEDEDRRLYSGKRYTYDQWQKLGFQVMKGERHVKRQRGGHYLFTFDQVTKIYGKKNKEG